MQKLGLRSCELWQGHVEPRKACRATSCGAGARPSRLDDFHRVREQFAKRVDCALGLQHQLQRRFLRRRDRARLRDGRRRSARRVITSSSNVKTVARVAPVAARHKMLVGMHNHSRIDPNEFATREEPDRRACRRVRSSPSTSTSATSPRRTKTPSRSCSSITPASSRCTSRIANAIRARTSRSARATRRSSPCCELLQRQRLADPGQHRIRIQGRRFGGRGGQVSRLLPQGPRHIIARMMRLAIGRCAALSALTLERAGS